MRFKLKLKDPIYYAFFCWIMVVISFFVTNEIFNNKIFDLFTALFGFLFLNFVILQYLKDKKYIN